MLSRLLDPKDGMPRDRAFWLVLAALVAGQLLAFYMLCSHQVRKAQARQAAAEVERMATNDCLQYLARSTIASCASPTARQSGAGGQMLGDAGPRAGAMPAAFALR